MTTLEGFVVMMIVCGAGAVEATTTGAGEYSTLEDENVSQKDGDDANEENGG